MSKTDHATRCSVQSEWSIQAVPEAIAELTSLLAPGGRNR